MSKLTEPGPCSCGRARDPKGRCWHCCDRLCEDCTAVTGSAFIAVCIRCQHLRLIWEEVFESANPKAHP